jgi:hypothetical protein
MATLSASDPQTQEVERDGSSLLRDNPFPNDQQGATTGGSTTTPTATATTPPTITTPTTTTQSSSPIPTRGTGVVVGVGGVGVVGVGFEVVGHYAEGMATLSTSFASGPTGFAYRSVKRDPATIRMTGAI